MRRVILLACCLATVLGCEQRKEPVAASTQPQRREQRLVTATISDPKTFNPITSVDASSNEAMSPLLDGLIRLNPETLQQEPLLAEQWEHNPEGTEYTFHLRRDVRWHDGVPFTAADVVFTFDAIFDDKVPNSVKHILTIEGERPKVTAVDDHTVKVILPRPFAPLLNALGVEIIPKHILGESVANGTFAQQWGINTPPEKLIGTGAYKMTRYVPSQFIEYRRNPDYWMKDDDGKPLPYLEAQTTLIVPDQNTTHLKFLAGQTHIQNPRPEEVADLRARADELQITVQEVGLDTGTTFVAFNRNPRHYVKDGKTAPQLKWFSDVRFLKGLAHAIDKQSMVLNCLNGYGKPAVAEISPENKLYHNPNLVDYQYDLDTARAVLKEAGYFDRDGDGKIEDEAGNPIELSLTTNAGNQVREKMCSIIKEDWSKLGITVNYRPLDFQALVEKLNSSFDWDAILIGFTASPEPHSGANMLRSSGNLHFWNPSQPQPATEWEAEIDRLLESGARELDVEKRRQHYWRIQEILHEQLPMLPTVRSTSFVAYKRSLQNYRRLVWGTYKSELIRFAD